MVWGNKPSFPDAVSLTRSRIREDKRRGGVGRRRKLLEGILSGSSDANIPFDQTRTLLSYLGFNERIKGSHHSFWREGMRERINLQPTGEGKCKPYQVRQMRKTLLEYQEELGI